MQVRIDHRNGTVHFGGQQLESDRIRDHISALARRLTKALHMVEPDVSKEVEARRLKVSDIFPSSAAHHTGHANKPQVDYYAVSMSLLLLGTWFIYCQVCTV